MWRPLALLCAALALGAAGPAAGATRILAIGDFGVGGNMERSAGAAMKRFEAGHPAALLATLGDNDYTESPSAFRRNWHEAFGWLPAAGVSVAGVLGNHDYAVDRGRYELATLGMPGRYYTRRVGDVELFLLDSNAIDDVQTRWLERRLKASRAAWRIAAFHHPPYVCGFHSGSQTVASRWVPLFERYGVRLVLSGHEHGYQRFLAQQGVTYIVDGGGGAVLYPPRSCPSGYPKRAAALFGFGFLSLVANGGTLTVSALDFEGRRVDRVTLAR